MVGINKNTKAIKISKTAIFGVAMLSVFGFVFALGGTASAAEFEDQPKGVMKVGTTLVPAPGLYIPKVNSSAEISAGREVYFKKCVWCHGPDGAGDGPSAIRLSTKPRNFNQGTFKIRHTASGALPTDEDLFNSVTHGLPGSVMPQWGGILSEEERHAVVAFVKKEMVKDREFDDPDELEEMTVIDCVIMGHGKLWEIKQERERIYALPEMSEEEAKEK